MQPAGSRDGNPALPDDLAAKPHLQEFYGTIPWSVRSIFAGMLGWFDGNPTNLFPLAPPERAQRIGPAGASRADGSQVRATDAPGNECPDRDGTGEVGHEDQGQGAKDVRTHRCFCLARLVGVRV